jgi:hypothetical protein
LTALITLDALTDLRELLRRPEGRATLIGISAIDALLLAELVEHVKAIGKDHKRFVDYITPATPSPPAGSSGDASPGGSGSAVGGSDQSTAGASSPAAGAVAEHAPSQFISAFGDILDPVVKIPVERLLTAVDSQAEAIAKGAAGIAELHAAHTASDARVTALEANFLQLEAAHRGLSDHVVEMDVELAETEEATELLGEAVREVGSPVIVVVEEGERANPGEPVRKTQTRSTRRAGTNVRKAQARKKK